MAEKLSPMMEHYLNTRKEYPDCILFYRLGDFYELFFDQAELVSRELELTLTGKDCGMEERAPMCGVPYHAADNYISRLIDKGYKVAICEQVEDPKLAKGLVERKVIRIVTPGTNLAPENLDEARNNYLFTISVLSGRYGIATADISTGTFYATTLSRPESIMDELQKFRPREVLADPEIEKEEETLFRELQAYAAEAGAALSSAPARYFRPDVCRNTLLAQFQVASLEGLGFSELPEAVLAAGSLLLYLADTQMETMSQINDISIYRTDAAMTLDAATRRNLELTETMRSANKRGSLLWVLDKTKTAMGARRLRHYVEMPLLDDKAINDRLDAVEELNRNLMLRDEMREYLSAVYDLERLMTRVSLGTANPRDMLSLRESIKYLPYIRQQLTDLSSGILDRIKAEFDPLEDIYELLTAIRDDAPLTVKEGGIFKDGYNAGLDEFKSTKANSKELLAALEEKERQNTGIRTLKLKYNRVFGYFLEVTNSFLSQVPDYFIRKQTLTGSERFTTTELNQLSDLVLGAEDKLFHLEYELFCEVRSKVGAEILRVQKMADFIAELDALASLSYVAVQNHYVRPVIRSDGRIDIINGRHPVVEQMLEDGQFIANDTHLDQEDHRIAVITGPNMAGKSTYMRQVALICLMAQIGSFVPAESAKISISDRIFTRVGASDDLAAGQSTFMVEMSEVANILRHATKRSLIIMDEIGRGTSTFDGLSIAWAVVEYIADPELLGAKTLFATHYHELTELEGKLPSVANYCIAVKQDQDRILFLRKIVPGGADRSYGIDVARLAGIPDAVIARAREIAAHLAEEDVTGNARTIVTGLTPAKSAPRKKSREIEGQLSLFSNEEERSIAAELRSLDIDHMTPVKSMLYLQELKERLQK